MAEPHTPPEGRYRPAEGTVPIPPLEAGLRRFLDALGAAADCLPAQPRLADLRQIAVEARLPWNRGGPWNAERHDARVTAGGLDVALRLYRPPGADGRAAFLYFHGGGWCLLNLDTHDRLLREYAAACGVVVVGIDYPLAPEVRFPRSLEVTTGVVRHLSEKGIDGVLTAPERYALGGDSSGANIAVAVALRQRAEGHAPPAALVLNYGVYDCDLSRASYTAFGQAPYQLTPAKIDGFWSHYCASPSDRAAPLASPLRAGLTGLPPCHLVIAGQDILKDENLAFAEALREAGVEVSVDMHGDAPHAFMEAFEFSDTPRRTVGTTAGWLRPKLGL
jgi:acetyl esterase